MHPVLVEHMNDLIGLLAGTLTTIAFVPQLLKLYATKSGRDVSARMFFVFSAGVVLWLVYGLRIKSAPVVISNTLTLVLSVIILGLKFRYSRPRQRVSLDADLP
jgi:MtN3 and saliva related transmembrane protein